MQNGDIGHDESIESFAEPLNPVWETEARSGPKIEVRTALLECAAEAFTARGYSATTLAYVADLMGASKGQIYYYYRSKNDLYLDVAVGAHYMLNQATMRAEKNGDQSPKSRLSRIAYAHTMTIFEKYPFMRVSLEATQHQLLSQNSQRLTRAARRIQEYREEYETKIETVISDGIASGDFSVPSLAVATKSVLGSLSWLTVWLDPQKETSSESKIHIAQQTAEFVVSGLMPAEPLKVSDI